MKYDRFLAPISLAIFTFMGGDFFFKMFMTGHIDIPAGIYMTIFFFIWVILLRGIIMTEDDVETKPKYHIFKEPGSKEWTCKDLEQGTTGIGVTPHDALVKCAAQDQNIYQ